MVENIFGTDGIRGKTNTYPIDPETVLKIALSTSFISFILPRTEILLSL